MRWTGSRSCPSLRGGRAIDPVDGAPVAPDGATETGLPVANGSAEIRAILGARRGRAPAGSLGDVGIVGRTRDGVSPMRRRRCRGARSSRPAGREASGWKARTGSGDLPIESMRRRKRKATPSPRPGSVKVMPGFEIEVPVPPSPGPPPMEMPPAPEPSPPGTAAGRPIVTEMTPGTSIDSPDDASAASATGSAVPVASEPNSTPIRGTTGAGEPYSRLIARFAASSTVCGRRRDAFSDREGGAVELDEGATASPPALIEGTTSRQGGDGGQLDRGSERGEREIPEAARDGRSSRCPRAMARTGDGVPRSGASEEQERDARSSSGDITPLLQMRRKSAPGSSPMGEASPAVRRGRPIMGRLILPRVG